MWPVHISVTECDPGLQTFHNDERLALFNGHNELRKDIAEGKQPNQQGKLPPAKNMYRLIYDCDMEVELMKEMDQCTGRATLTETYGQNFLKECERVNFTRINSGTRHQRSKSGTFETNSENSKLPAAIMPALGGGNDPKSNRLKVAMGVWKGPQTYYGLNNISDYDDNRLYTFANMAHAKTLRFGCGYKECNNNADVHISCIYNLEGGYPHSVIYEKGKACEKNKDCTTYKGSKCDQKLCVFEGKPPVPGSLVLFFYLHKY
ncbi:SCP-like protein [Ancylostoma ceylanicum]|uniref:SCP-like protein n=1 Tax=Ancylostoma ceylanicum TaxID=53326 RepID=A0A0D6MCP4_9BILA|nr:SCP-like protein [Ancylostoma ceylanicum]